VLSNNYTVAGSYPIATQCCPITTRWPPAIRSLHSVVQKLHGGRQLSDSYTVLSNNYTVAASYPIATQCCPITTRWYFVQSGNSSTIGLYCLAHSRLHSFRIPSACTLRNMAFAGSTGALARKRDGAGWSLTSFRTVGCSPTSGFL
jgi:hypothetical protein